ncbi:MAG: hypothetical protein WBC85_02250 [Planktotalea sp.]
MTEKTIPLKPRQKITLHASAETALVNIPALLKVIAESTKSAIPTLALGLGYSIDFHA